MANQYNQDRDEFIRTDGLKNVLRAERIIDDQRKERQTDVWDERTGETIRNPASLNEISNRNRTTSAKKTYFIL